MRITSKSTSGENDQHQGSQRLWLRPHCIHLWDTSVKQVRELAYRLLLSKGFSGPPETQQYEPQGNVAPKCTCGWHQAELRQQFPSGSPGWGWRFRQVPASTPGSWEPPGHWRYHLLWVWEKSSNISKWLQASAQLLETDASLEPQS